MEQGERAYVKNPKETANVFSVLTFWYTLDLFRTGYKKVLEINDLFKPLKDDESGFLGDSLEK